MPDGRGALIAAGVGVATVNVAPETVDRALAALDALIKTVLRLGYSVPSQASPATLFIEGAHVPFALIERFVRNGEPPDEAETARRESYAVRYPGFAKRVDLLGGWIYRPSGKLTVMIGERDERGLQHRWGDAISHRVESRIEEIAAEAVAHAQVIRTRRDRIGRGVAKRGEVRQQREMKRDRPRRSIELLRKRIDLIGRVENVANLLEKLRAVSADDYSMREFLEWADAQVALLREHFSAAGH